MRKVFVLITVVTVLFLASSCEMVDTVKRGAEVVSDVTKKIGEVEATAAGYEFREGEVLCAWFDNYEMMDNRYFSFQNAFHGRILGFQLAGGLPGGKKWIVGEGQTFVQVPFPDGYKNEDTSFELFLSSLETQGIRPQQIAGVITESYQGVGPDFLPYHYAQRLEQFCKEHDIVTIFDEVQAGFGRTGRMFTFEHYDVAPDLIVCGKGISSSLPLSAVICLADIMNLYPPGSMTSTHSANPLSVTAAVTNLKIIQEEKLVERSRRLGDMLIPGLEKIQQKHAPVLGCVTGKGLLAGIQVVQKGGKSPDPETALGINERCFQKGLLMFAPVGVGG